MISLFPDGPKEQFRVRVAGTSIPMPASRIARIFIGLVLILSGLLGFLPILGFWMIPLGLVILSVDLAPVRRARRRLEVWWAKRKGRKSRKDGA